MDEIRIIVDLPSEDMIKTLKIQPMDGKYDSERLKIALEKRLPLEFPQARVIKVNVVSTNAFFGIDVMGLRTGEVLETMKKVSDSISSIIKEESGVKSITLK
jgi:hypothetical protein